ncbi:MAG: hypothetical protein PVSMB1_02250 [Gemmatimonadaceae bacterium]
MTAEAWRRVAEARPLTPWPRPLCHTNPRQDTHFRVVDRVFGQYDITTIASRHRQRKTISEVRLEFLRITLLNLLRSQTPIRSNRLKRKALRTPQIWIVAPALAVSGCNRRVLIAHLGCRWTRPSRHDLVAVLAEISNPGPDGRET